MYSVEKYHESGISAKIVQDSIDERGNRITTFELEFHRWILAEFNTHRVFSRNAMSSRAVPVRTMTGLIKQKPASPSHWGKKQAGMQANEENNEAIGHMKREEYWQWMANTAVSRAEELDDAGYHKQIVNRILEPFMFIRNVCL